MRNIKQHYIKDRSATIPISTETMRNFQYEMTERELSKNTFDAYSLALQQFSERYSEVSRRTISEYKAYMMDERGLSAKTVNLKLNAISQFCKANGVYDMTIRHVKIQRYSSVENVISRADYERLLRSLKAAGDMRWYFIVKLMGSTGCRVSELIRITKADFDRGYAEMHTKGKVRRILIPKSFLDEAAGYYKDFSPKTPLCLNMRGKPASTRTIASRLYELAGRYDIDKAVMHPHSFRHMFAIEFLKASNNDLTLLSDLLGHSSVATTSIYTRRTREEQINAVNNSITW